MPAADDHDILAQLAERLGLDEGETENFVTSSMRRLGHRANIAWVDVEESGDEGGGDFFSKKRAKRNVGPQQQRPASGGWQYPQSGS
jgi:hypothetical protein